MIKPFCAKLYFIGAGPGDPDLITVKGRRILEQARLVVYAGSLVPKETVACAVNARLVNSASLTLEEVHKLCCEALEQGQMVARVHTGDPSLYGTIKEQIQLLEQAGYEYEIVPGVSAAFAAAAAAKVSFTVPELCQSLILTRLGGRTPVPESENLASLVSHNCAVALYLSAGNAEELDKELACVPEERVIICAYRVGWADELIVRTTRANLLSVLEKHKFDRQTVFLILPGESEGGKKSRLYASDFAHGFR